MKRLPLHALLSLCAIAGCKSAKSTSAPSSEAYSASGSTAVAPGGDAGGERYAMSSKEAAPASAPMDGASDGARDYEGGADYDDAAPMAEAEPAPSPEAPSAAPDMHMEADEAPSAKVAVSGRSKRARRSSRKKDRRSALKKRKPRRPVEEPPEFKPQLQAGRLTAGAFDDTLNPAVLGRFAERMSQQHDTRDVADLVAGPMTIVTVVDDRGRPIHDADVRISQGRGGKSVPTGTDGRAIFFSDWDMPASRDRREGRPQAVIRHGHQSITAPIREGTTQTITLPQGRGDSVHAVDIALVIDATGSMGDELEYLKVELRNIARTVDRAFPDVDQRYALVVYRDEGDDYVSRSFDFTTRLSSFERDLGRQQANGGGDYPEAMHAALDDATHLSWNDGAAKMVFLVADAPPHGQDMRRTMQAVDELRGQGVGFYPVAASGVAAEAEIVMRAAAASSGGQYLFLTDDSGVGNSHAEPHIPCYEVQALRDVMIRMVHTEIAGERITADPRRTVRSVGRDDDGICQVLTRAQ